MLNKDKDWINTMLWSVVIVSDLPGSSLHRMMIETRIARAVLVDSCKDTWHSRRWLLHMVGIREKEKGIIIQFSSVTRSCPTLCDPMNHSSPGLPVHHQLPEFTQTHVHRVGDAIQPSHPLSSPSPPALNLSQHQGLFQWVNSSHEVAKVLQFQFQHQSFHWTPRTDLL